MKLNDMLFKQMRAATRSVLKQGPAAATTAIQNALQGLRGAPAAKARPMSDINPPPGAPQPTPKPAPAEQAASARSDAVSDLLASLGVANPMGRDNGRAANGLAGFDLPRFEMPSFGAPLHAPGVAPTLPGQFIDGSYSNAAGSRSYKLYVPSGYHGQALPLVVMLHGCTQSPDDFALGTGMNRLAEERPALVLYPAQSAQANQSRCWNWFSAIDQTRDQGEPSLIAGMTRAIMDSHAVDQKQVYVAGLSAGGAMAVIMGTLYPELYAAVGVHSGLPFASAHDLPSAMAAMQGNFGQARHPGKALPIIVFHGDRDTTVHPGNGDALMAQGLPHRADSVKVEPGRVPDGRAYTRTVHQNADGTPIAEQWVIHGAGHAWSGGSAHGSYTDGKGPDASREMLRFFSTER